VQHDAFEDATDRAAFVHHEIFQLAILILVAVAAFFLTRAVAANNRAMSARDAAEWYARGQQALGRGQIDLAIDALRRATVRNRAATAYMLALARALALHHDDEAARRLLLRLREAEPEDAEINLELARLAAHRGDVTEAVRFYHNALYAPWPPQLTDARRRVRLELIQLLVAHDQPARAQAELLAVATDVPDQPAAHVEIAQLFFQVGDYAHALDHFERAVRLAPDDGVALAGAGQSAFRLGEYARARSYFARAPRDLDDVAATREIVEFVLADDPFASRIGSAERRRRLVGNVEYARQRLAACIGEHPPDENVALQGELDDFATSLRRSSAIDQDMIEAGVDLVLRAAQEIVKDCAPATPRDRALVLIGRQHSGAAR
jgi:tetratricopeptide (TPR) repeat protein